MAAGSTAKKKITFNEAVKLVNELTTATLLTRLRERTDPDRKRDLNEECSYPESINIDDYLKMYNREGVAARVVDIYPDECWAVDPVVYETEGDDLTPFELKWADLCKDEEINPLHYLHKLDVRSGIGRFGVMLLGFDDEKELSEPVPGIKEDGTEDTGTARDLNLIYLRVFDESMVDVKKTEVRNNRRIGKPLIYTLKMADTESPEAGNGEFTSTRDVDVHWTRIIHAAENLGNSEVYAAPRMEKVYNKLLDVRKILGSSGEMFYKGGFPGISIEVDPRVLELGIDIDQDSIDEEIFKYMNGLQRYLSLVGLQAKSLAPQVASPIDHLTAQLNSIAMSIGSPLRIFMGSEQAQLASGQDVRTWNRRLQKRQHRYLTPRIVRPFLNRLIMARALPKPKTFEVWWPDINLPDETERTQNADRMAAAMMKYVMSKAYQVMQPSDFFRFILKLDQAEIDVIMKKLKEAAEVDFIEDAPEAGGPPDSGSKGSSPSNPKKGGKTG